METTTKPKNSKKNSLGLLITVAFFSAILSFLFANLIFKTPARRSTQVPVVPPVSTDFPDVYNDPVYNSFLNHNSLDLTLPVQIGKSKNKNPFNGQ